MRSRQTYKCSFNSLMFSFVICVLASDGNWLEPIYLLFFQCSNTFLLLFYGTRPNQKQKCLTCCVVVECFSFEEVECLSSLKLNLGRTSKHNDMITMLDKVTGFDINVFPIIYVNIIVIFKLNTLIRIRVFVRCVSTF